MPENDSGNGSGNKFWLGQNIFVVMAGGGVVIVAEHLIWGSICIVVGICGFLYSKRKEPMKPTPSSVVWIAALALTWAAIGYDVYDRHSDPDIPEETPDEAMVFAYGGSAMGRDYQQIIVNGDRFWKYRGRYKLAFVAFIYEGLGDPLDAPHLQASKAYDIVKGHITMLVRLGPSFFQYLQEKRIRGINLSLLMVPNGVDTGQFDTLRQAKAFGVRKVWTGSAEARLAPVQ